MWAARPQTWRLLNLFLVSFDKLPCLHRDIPLTQPLVIVYTASRQSRHALSGFDSNIHFASEVRYPKWLDHSSLFLQLLPPFSSPHSVFFFRSHWHHLGLASWQRAWEIHNIHKYIFFGVGGRRRRSEGGGIILCKWTILIRPSHPLLWVCVSDVGAPPPPLFFLCNRSFNVKRHKKGDKATLHRLLLAVAFNYFN